MTEISDGYVHPDSGREYREGDPARRFAQLTNVLAQECERYLHHYERRLEGKDYLAQHLEWPSDPDRVARAMGQTIADLDKAYTSVITDRTMHEYGLGKKDDEWERKYGEVRQEGGRQ
jgi:hypothetical protein